MSDARFNPCGGGSVRFTFCPRSCLLTGSLKFAAVGGSSLGRSIHAYLGSATMLALVAHAYYGLNLGLSF